jgi:hypothetical protein
VLREVLFHRATKAVRIEMICRSFKHFSQKHANRFVPLPNQPENNDCGGGHPACRRAGLPARRTYHSHDQARRIFRESLKLQVFFPGGQDAALYVRQDARRYISVAHPRRESQAKLLPKQACGQRSVGEAEIT